MHKAIRSQADDLGDFYSNMAGIETTGWEDTARQEFKSEADINVMLAKFGVMTPQRPLQFGEIDYTIDLQQAIEAVAEAKRVWERMPDDVKAAYPSWESLLNAAISGELRIHLEAEPEPPPPPVEPEPPPPPVEEGA